MMNGFFVRAFRLEPVLELRLRQLGTGVLAQRDESVIPGSVAITTLLPLVRLASEAPFAFGMRRNSSCHRVFAPTTTGT